MTFKEIRRYTAEKASRYCALVEQGQVLEAKKIETAVIDRAIGGRYDLMWLFNERKPAYVISQFVRACRARGFSTVAIHFARNGEVR